MALPVPLPPQGWPPRGSAASPAPAPALLGQRGLSLPQGSVAAQGLVLCAHLLRCLPGCRWLAENEHLARAADDPSQLDPDAAISGALAHAAHPSRSARRKPAAARPGHARVTLPVST